jgi:hypothetical protein
MCPWSGTQGGTYVGPWLIMYVPGQFSMYVCIQSYPCTPFPRQGGGGSSLVKHDPGGLHSQVQRVISQQQVGTEEEVGPWPVMI